MSGWTYVAGDDSRYADGQMNQIIVTMAALILFVFVLLIIMSILGAFRVYQPVKELVSQVKKIVPEQPQAEGEFDLIRQGLHALTNSNEELQTMIRRQKSQLTELFAFRLIRGRMGETDSESMGRLGLQFQPCLYVVSVLFCKNGRDENTVADRAGCVKSGADEAAPGGDSYYAGHSALYPHPCDCDGIRRAGEGEAGAEAFSSA